MTNYLKKFLNIFILLFISFFLLSCEEETSSKIQVGVTIIPQSTFVKKVCGDLVDVVVMVPTGSSPETYEPKPKDMMKLDKAYIYFTIGVPTEETSILKSIPKDTKIVNLEKKVSEVYDDVTFDNGGRDPHIWLSPKRVIVMVESIRDEMSKIDPLNQDTYKKNAKSFIEELNNLDMEIKSALEKSQINEFIAFHPAFGYLASDYGLTMYALEEEGKDVTPQHLRKMIDLAKEKNIKVIFYQEEVDGTKAKSFAEEINGEAIMLEPLSADYINNLLLMAKTIVRIEN